jgi:hypothetical protein
MTNAERLLKRLISDKALPNIGDVCGTSLDGTSLNIFGTSEAALDEIESRVRRSRAYRSFEAPIIRRLVDGNCLL